MARWIVVRSRRPGIRARSIHERFHRHHALQHGPSGPMRRLRSILVRPSFVLVGHRPMLHRRRSLGSQVTVEAACDNCPTGGGPLPQPSFFTYYEQLLPEAFQGNRMTQCDVFDWPAPACGVGSRGYLKVIGDQRYFCLSDFPGSVNPFAGAPTGPIPAAFATCACIPGWTSGTFPHLLFATPPAWWTNFRAVAVRSSHVSWDCCQAQSPSTCQCLP